MSVLKFPWLRQCILSDSRNPRPLPNVHNAVIALSRDDSFRDQLEFDLMTQKANLAGDDTYPRPITPDDVTQIQMRLQKLGLRQLSREVTIQAIEHVARKNSFHPVRDYLTSCAWDGIARLDTWLAMYLGTELTAYTSAIGRMFLISMVARVFDPGCKVDHMIVLEGPQGVLKSSACRVLASEPWFSDHLPDIGASKEVSMHLRGKWLIEVPELHAFSKAEATLLKSFLSRTHERFRPPYGVAEVDEPRQCVFIGTSNKDAYLRDETGGRRFWPVKCGDIQITQLEANRDNLFAEALIAYKAREPWWPNHAFEAEFIKPHQAERFEIDIWGSIIEDYLTSVLLAETVTIRHIAQTVLEIPKERMDSRTEKRIVSVLQSLDWTRGKIAGNRVWVRPKRKA